MGQALWEPQDSSCPSVPRRNRRLSMHGLHRGQTYRGRVHRAAYWLQGVSEMQPMTQPSPPDLSPSRALLARARGYLDEDEPEFQPVIAEIDAALSAVREAQK